MNDKSNKIQRNVWEKSDLCLKIRINKSDWILIIEEFSSRDFLS